MTVATELKSLRFLATSVQVELITARSTDQTDLDRLQRIWAIAAVAAEGQSIDGEMTLDQAVGLLSRLLIGTVGSGQLARQADNRAALVRGFAALIELRTRLLL